MKNPVTDAIIQTLQSHPETEWKYRFPASWAMVYYHPDVSFEISVTPLAGVRMHNFSLEHFGWWDKRRINWALKKWYKNK